MATAKNADLAEWLLEENTLKLSDAMNSGRAFPSDCLYNAIRCKKLVTYKWLLINQPMVKDHDEGPIRPLVPEWIDFVDCAGNDRPMFSSALCTIWDKRVPGIADGDAAKIYCKALECDDHVIMEWCKRHYPLSMMEYLSID